MSKCQCQNQLLEALQAIRNGSVALPDNLTINIKAPDASRSCVVCYECRKASRCRRAWYMVFIVTWTSITLGAGIHWINYLITTPLP